MGWFDDLTGANAGKEREDAANREGQDVGAHGGVLEQISDAVASALYDSEREAAARQAGRENGWNNRPKDR